MPLFYLHIQYVLFLTIDDVLTIVEFTSLHLHLF